MTAYNIVPGVDNLHNFPPEIRDALSHSNELRTALLPYIASLVINNSAISSVTAESGYVYVIADQIGQVALGVKPDGTIIGKFTVSNGLIDYPQLSPAVQAAVPVLTAGEDGYVYKLVDNAAHLALGIRTDGTVYIPKVALPAGSVDVAQLSAGIASAVSSAPSSLSTESGYSYLIVDSAGKMALGVRGDGTVVLPKASLPAGSVDTAQLSASVLASLASAPSTVPVESGYVYQLVDQNNRLALGIRPDGTVIIPKTNIPSFSTRIAESINYIAHPFVDTNGKYQIRVTRRSDGQVTIVTTGSYNSVEPTLTEDDKLLFRNDQSGVMTGYWCLANGTGSTWLLSPTTDIYAPGDSLTAGAGASPSNSYPSVLASMLGVSVVNDGLGGQSGDIIAARANGVNGELKTAAAFTLPADTSAVVVTWNIPTGASGNWSRTGVLAGIPGTITYNSSTVQTTFARTTAGASVVIPSGSIMVFDYGVAAQQNTLSIYLGRNNYKNAGAPAAIVSQVQSILNYHKSFLRRFVVLEILPFSTNDESGLGAASKGPNYDQLVAANTALSTAFPNNFVAVAQYLRSAQAAIDAGITYTAQDNIDIANAITPTSFRSDTGHLNDVGYPLIGKYVANFMRQKGWY